MGKDKRYANRGQSFEHFLRFANDQYKKDGVAIVEKIPTEFLPLRDRNGRICGCKVVDRSSVDFIGRVGTFPLAAESKETKTDTIRWDAVQDHQAEFLTAYEGQKDAICMVLVSFNLEKVYAVPWGFWKAGRDAWKVAQSKNKRKADKILWENEYGTPWETTGKASIKESEMCPEWEVEIGGRYGVDYLRKYRVKP